MFLTGVIADMGVFILVHTGAMHNIIDINVARAIDLWEQHIDTTILIGSGTKVTCRAASLSTPLRIDNEVSTIDVFLLNIGKDINVVLGTPWSASLRRLTWDFTSMELQYHDRSCAVTPAREHQSSPSSAALPSKSANYTTSLSPSTTIVRREGSGGWELIALRCYPTPTSANHNTTPIGILLSRTWPGGALPSVTVVFIDIGRQLLCVDIFIALHHGYNR